MIYRWGDRYGLYHALTANPDILEEEEDLEDFFDGYSNSFIVELDGIKKDIRIAEITVGFNEVNINGFQSRLNSLSPSNTMETNALEYSWMYFGLARGVQSYGDIEDDVEALANQCVFYGGPAVWEARSLKIRNDFTAFGTDWEGSCDVPSSKWDNDETLSIADSLTPDYQLIPNFFMGSRMASVTLGEKEAGLLEIYGIDGRLAGEYSLSTGINTLNLSKSLTSKGVFVYKVKINGEYRTTDKVIVLE